MSKSVVISIAELCVVPVLLVSGVRGAAAGEEDSASHVHYTLLIACVLLAFSLGAASSGLLVSRFRGGGAGRRDARRNGKFDKDPEASLPRALSPHTLAKLGGLLDPEPEVSVKPRGGS